MGARVVITSDQRDRAAVLRAEGMQVWSCIRRNPVLLALHEQFAPPARYRRG